MSKRGMGSFGSRMGAAWSREWADYRLRRDGDAVQSNTASTQETVTPPSQDALRRAIQSETCPFCGGGPYKNLGLHTNIAHGISAAELREMSGLDRVCAEALSMTSREALLRRPDRDEITSRGGRESMRRQKEAGRRPGSTHTTLATAAAVAKWSAVAAERDPDVCARARRGESLADIGRAWGIHPRTVRIILRRHGVEPTLEQTNAGRRARLAEHRDRARQTLNERLASERTARLARFVELGADWPAVVTLAEECGMSRKAMRAFLARNGYILDGRRRSA